jgi:hypothetical protein
MVKVIKIDDVEYVRKDDLEVQQAERLEGMKYVIVRSYNAGVFAGYLKSKKDQEVILKKARRIWYWAGAATLSQLAVDGTSNPTDCKFPCEVETIEINQVIEVIDCTEKARQSIQAVKVWSV